MIWKELQSRFCIHSSSNTADPDFKLSKSCKSLYSSLVKVEKDVIAIAPSDDVIDPVHDTTRT